MLLPGHDDRGGGGGDRQAAAHPPGLVIVVDQVVLPVYDLDAAGAEGDDLAGAPAGVAQDLVDRLVHQLHAGRGDRAGPAGRAEQVQAGVKLGDHHLGQGLAGLVFVRVVADPVPGCGTERAGHRFHQAAGTAVLDDLAELVGHQVAVRRRVKGAAGPVLRGDRVEDAGEVAGTEAGRVSVAGQGQGTRCRLACAYRLPQPLQAGAGGPGPVPDDLPQPGRLDDPQVDHAAGGRPAAGGVDAQVQQGDLPDVAGERVGAAVPGPGLVQVPAQVTEQSPGRRVVLRPAGLADGQLTGLAQRGGAVKAGQQDPDLGGVQRRGRLIAAPQRERHLGLQQFRQPGQGELVHSEAGPPGGYPGCELLARQHGDGVRAKQPLVMETAQPATGDAFTVTAGDPASGGPRERPGPGDERRDGFAAVLAPVALVPEAQPRAVPVAFAAGYCAAVRAQRPPRASRRGGIELIPAGPRPGTGPAASVAASRRASCRCRAPRCPARPRRCPRRCQVPGEQQQAAVPFAGAPGRVQPGAQPFQPSARAGLLAGRAGGHRRQRCRAAHRYRFPAAAASTARRLSSSRACK